MIKIKTIWRAFCKLYSRFCSVHRVHCTVYRHSMYCMWPLTKFAEKEELMPCQICTLALHMHYVQYMAQHLHNLNSRRREVHKLSIPRTLCSPDPSAPGGQKRNYCGGWFENCSPGNTWPVQSVPPVQSTLKRVNKILCPLRGKALSSSLQFEPISDLFLSLGNAHAHINIRWFNEEGLKYFCIVVVVCFSLKYKIHEQT